METTDITFVTTSRSGHDLFIVVKTPRDRPLHPERLAFLAHGLNDVHDSAPMRALTCAFLEAGYRVVLWDAANSRGRSGGRLEDVTVTQYGLDLRSVVAWARGQAWFCASYALGGHSLGAGAVGEYAAEHPTEVSRLVLVAPVVSGSLVMRHIHPILLLWWRWKGITTHPRAPKDRYNWEFMRSLTRFNLLPLASRLTMPVLFVVGTRDRVTTPSDAMRLYLRLPAGRRKFALIYGARHKFETTRAQEDLSRRVETWLRQPDGQDVGEAEPPRVQGLQHDA